MPLLFTLFRAIFFSLFRSRELALENLALRQQLAMYRHRLGRPRATPFAKLFWTAISRFWSGWRDCLVVVKPATVVRWHAQAWALFWRWKSGISPGRPAISAELRALIIHMAKENTSWGARRIHAELEKLELHVCKSSIASILQTAGFDPWPGRDGRRQSWRTFLKNESAWIAAIDFFTVPTAFFKVLSVVVILDHSRRRLLHFSVTTNPTTEWVANQIRQAFPWNTAPKYLIRDRDPLYGQQFQATLKSFKIEQVVCTKESPWQNGYVERFIGSVRRDLLDNVVVFNEAHLRHLLAGYDSYYNRDRCHQGLDGDTPEGRPVQPRPPNAELIALPRCGGLHHRYAWREAA